MKDYSKYQFPELAKAFDDLMDTLLATMLRAVNWVRRLRG